jgi:hypothetical protein
MFATSTFYEESMWQARDFFHKRIEIGKENVLLTCPKIGGQLKRCVLTCDHDETKLQRNG